jgi:hypothetical protein
VVDALGDRAIKSDNPIVSSKIDFADFLGLIVGVLRVRWTRRAR